MSCPEAGATSAAPLAVRDLAFGYPASGFDLSVHAFDVARGECVAIKIGRAHV